MKRMRKERAKCESIEEILVLFQKWTLERKAEKKSEWNSLNVRQDWRVEERYFCHGNISNGAIMYSDRELPVHFLSLVSHKISARDLSHIPRSSSLLVSLKTCSAWDSNQPALRSGSEVDASPVTSSKKEDNRHVIVEQTESNGTRINHSTSSSSFFLCLYNWSLPSNRRKVFNLY